MADGKEIPDSRKVPAPTPEATPPVEETKGGPEMPDSKKQAATPSSKKQPTVESTKSGPVNPPVPPKPESSSEDVDLKALMARLAQLEENQAELQKRKDASDDEVLHPSYYPIPEASEASTLPELFVERSELEELISREEVASRFGVSSDSVAGYTVRGFDPDDAYLIMVDRETGEKKAMRWG